MRPSLQPDQKIYYRIRLQGRISQRWTSWLGDMKIIDEIEGRGDTVSTVAIEVADQAAMLGTLNKMHNLGYSLLKIEQMAEPWNGIVEQLNLTRIKPTDDFRSGER